MNNSNTRPCDISPTHICLIRDYLANYGISDFFYGVAIKMKPTSIAPFKRLQRRRADELINASFMGFSSPEIMEYRHQYLSHFASADEGYFELQQMGLNILKNADLSTVKGQQLQRLRDGLGIKSWGTWRLPTKYNPNWDSVFVFFSNLEQDTLKQKLLTNNDEIDHQLLLYSTLFNDQCIAQLNPITNYNCLSTKSMQVLELTAQGYSSEEIGERLVISESGVNYHQNRLKELFNAKNRAQLVSAAHTLGVLD
ncbi:helix-turn-helix transcriptional regulator [Shewanella benthica]|nr:helix-turn-helix transcriptional regulator [Shewanella benthica]